MSVRDKIKVAIFLCVAVVIPSALIIYLHPIKPDPYWNLPLTKGDLYLCTALLIMFGRGK